VDFMDKIPITSMSIEGMRYWMRDQADHAIFVRDDLSANYVKSADEALRFSGEFQSIEEAAINKSATLDNMIRKAQPLVMRFANCQNGLLRDQLAGDLLAKGYPTFRDHLVRESQYYLRWTSGNPPDRTDPEDILFETPFWLRQMVEHSLFLMHWADPYEYALVKAGQDYAKRFDELLSRARLFVSMMSSQPVPEIPSPPGTELGSIPPLAAEPEPPHVLTQLVTQSISLTTEYRDYLLRMKPAVEDYRVMGIITSLFMDHQMREADFSIANLNNIATGDSNAFSAEYAAMPFKKDKQEEALYHPMPQ
jgi:hypothetical protein